MNKIESIQKITLQLLYKDFESNYSQLRQSKERHSDNSKIPLSAFRNIQDNNSS